MIITAILIYLFIVLMFYVFQRKLLFRPTADGYTHIDFGKGLHGKVLNPDYEIDAIIYFGGNNEQILDNFESVFPDHSVYLIPYRGYSGNPGKPTEAGLFEDAEYIYDLVSRDHQRNVTVIGRSLGSGVAAHIASVKPVHRLVLITPYDSIERVAFDHYPFMPMSLIVRDKFRSYEKAPAIVAPTMIIIACWDQTIKYGRVNSLMKSFNTGVIQSLLYCDCNHTDILEHIQYDDVRKFL